MRTTSKNLIFIVDDDPDDRQIILDAFLEKNPALDYIFMDSAQELLKNLDDENAPLPALILLDLNMPGILGLQALKEIRGNKLFSQLPIIILTTSTLNNDKKASYELGVSCFITKPDLFSKLVEIIAAILILWFTDIESK
ncbi:MAG TPA: response regulator [Puia sp.]|nr:response regulator [Puia sp.]